jgi:hypothetical protein
MGASPVEEGMNNLGWLTATPDGRQSKDADQIIKAALKALDLLGGMFELHFHARPPPRVAQSA